MKTVVIDYKTLRDEYTVIFKEPGIGEEVYYKKVSDGWIIQLHKNNWYIKCHVTEKDLMEEAQQQVYEPDILNAQEEQQEEMTQKDKDELLKGKIASFEVTYLRKGIKVIKFEGEEETIQPTILFEEGGNK